MVKSIISCGKYDKKYKYMIYYILIRLVLEYFLGDVDFPDEMKIEFLRNEFFPKSILIFDMFRSFGMIIFAIMLLNFESKNIEEKNKNKNKISELQLISFNEPVELIHYETKKPTSRFYMIIIIALLYNINSKLIKFFYQFGFLGIDLWMIQIIIICLIKRVFFKVVIFIHQKIAIAFILIFSTLMKLISIIIIFVKDEENDNVIYKDKPGLFCLGFFGFILLYLIDSYMLCKMKWYFELKFISLNKMILYLGITGFIIFFICSIIVNFFKCDNSEFSLHVCLVHEKDNNTTKYFDNFEIFFKDIWRKEREEYNVAYIFIFLLKIIFNSINWFLQFSIIKNLNPEFWVCSDSILYSIIKMIRLIYYISTNNLNNDFIFDFISQLFSLFGTIIYLELIELNFCGLNFYLKKNIDSRARNEYLHIYEIPEEDYSSGGN